MKLRLTDSQVVLLEWDRKKPDKVGKGWREYNLTDSDITHIKEIAETIAYCSDNSSAAKALIRKLEKIN